MGGPRRARVAARTPVTPWTGTYALPAAAAPVAIVVRDGTVSLGPGHASSLPVQVTVDGAHVRFVVPDRVVFDGTIRGRTLRGVVRQGSLRGTFSLRRGVSRIVELLGIYRSAAGAGVAVAEADGLPPTLLELPSGAVHGIGASLTVGARLGDTRGDGAIRVDAHGFVWQGTQYDRFPVRQQEVRVGVDAATLTLPPGRGPFPAVVMVHGSGPRTRDEFDLFTAFFALHGIAVLADDKRGVGESRGAYPGDAATTAAIDLLARDAQAEVAFLARRPRIDPRRIGLFGDSQAGWISPLAAVRDPAIGWLVSNSGPTVSVGETDEWASLAGESEAPPSGTPAAMLAAVRAQGPSGYDPASTLRRLAIPALWLYGGDDRNVPTELCVERLTALQPGHDFTWVVLPTTHTPLVLPTGLLSSLPQSPGFDPRFFPALADWLRGHNLTR
ncbi:MAG TPA: alpha/beta hydrolase [Gaiellaceae bacterium]|nr:alpha/beta hydrolase [Gaiellaceae bacterium]